MIQEDTASELEYISLQVNSNWTCYNRETRSYVNPAVRLLLSSKCRFFSQ